MLRCREGASCDDLFAAVRDLASDPSLAPGAPVLLDARAGSFLPTPKQVHEIAELRGGSARAFGDERRAMEWLVMESGTGEE